MGECGSNLQHWAYVSDPDSLSLLPRKQQFPQLTHGIKALEVEGT